MTELLMTELLMTELLMTELLIDDDLRYNKYSIAKLEENIDRLTNKMLLCTQRLTAEFCVKYILSEYCDSRIEDAYINVYDVLQAQPHITKEELSEALINFKKAIGEWDEEEEKEEKEEKVVDQK